jgi:predicted GIY-YIG superfamily endonuclease
MYTVYILKIAGKKNIYIGVTKNFERRLSEHIRGGVKSTRGRFEKVLLKESYQSKNDAWKREGWLKSGAGRAWIKENVI